MINRIKLLSVVGLCLLINLLSVQIPIANAQSTHLSRVVKQGTKGNVPWEVSVSARDRWFDTRISVSPGDTLSFEASGTIVWAPPGGHDISGTVGPNGTRPPFPQDARRFPMPGAGCGSLIVKIGGAVFSIGEGKSFTTSESGTVMLMVNDDLLFDNRGNFLVNIGFVLDTKPNLDDPAVIVFSSNAWGNQEVLLLDTVSGSTKNLSQSASSDGYPRCSVTNRVAFATDRDGSWEVYSMETDGRLQMNETRNRDGSGYIDWSPDGRRLVFASTRFGQAKNDIYILNEDKNAKRITSHAAEDVHPAWSPDGTKIAFASERDGNRQIYSMNADGTDLVRLMTNRAYDDYPSWRSDSSAIVFASDRDSKRSDKLELYVFYLDDRSVQRLTVNNNDDRHPAWSPGGPQILFASDRNGDRDIFLMQEDGSSVKRLFSAPGADEHPHWCANAIVGEILNDEVNQIPSPRVPPAAAAIGARGRVNVYVQLQADKVIRATAYSGHPLLRAAAAAVARKATFKPGVDRNGTLVITF